MSCTGVPVYSGVEGVVDGAVVERLMRHLGILPGSIIDCGGKPTLKAKLKAFNHSARKIPWLVLADLDTDAPCAPHLRRVWLPAPARCMCLRFAVPQVESWLIADVERFAETFRVARAKIPQNPESIPNAKRALVNIVRNSRSAAIKADMVPRPGSARDVGPAYTSRLIEFISDAVHGWRPEVAERFVPSLSATVAALRRFAPPG